MLSVLNHKEAVQWFARRGVGSLQGQVGWALSSTLLPHDSASLTYVHGQWDNPRISSRITKTFLPMILIYVLRAPCIFTMTGSPYVSGGHSYIHHYEKTRQPDVLYEGYFFNLYFPATRSSAPSFTFPPRNSCNSSLL